MRYACKVIGLCKSGICTTGRSHRKRRGYETEASIAMLERNSEAEMTDSLPLDVMVRKVR